MGLTPYEAFSLSLHRGDDRCPDPRLHPSRDLHGQRHLRYRPLHVLPDLIAPDNRVFDNMNGFSIALANPAGGFQAPIAIPVGVLVANLAAADFNKDGNLDLLLTSPLGTAVVFGNGNGTFSAPQFLTLPVTPLAGGNCAAVDVNKDGFVDVLVPGANGLAVLLGNGNGTFRPATLFPTALIPAATLRCSPS